MQSELKPCPFCGGEPHLMHCGVGTYMIQCLQCKATTDDGFRDRVSENWNRRALTAALSDKKAGETFTREKMLAEVERRVERALAARSALVDVPAVEPDQRLYDGTKPMADGGDTPMTAAEEVLAWLLVEKIGVPDDVPYSPDQAQEIIARQLSSPPLSREGEDSAEMVTLTRAEADRIAQRLEFDASWDKCGDGYYSIKRQLGTLAATRSDSATSPKGGEE